MIKLAICEDEKLFRVSLYKLLKTYLQEKGIAHIIDCYEKGEQLLEGHHKQYDILYLDVEIKDGMDGITLAKRLRQENNRGQIVFLTSHQEEAYKAFEVNAFRYLLKPLQQDKLYETMDLLIPKIKDIRDNEVIFKVNQGFIRLQLQEILYIETYERRLRVMAVDKEYRVDSQIGEIENQLKDRQFFRIHKSVLINLEHIKEHNNSTVIMRNGVMIPISRLKLSAFKQQFVAYLQGSDH